MRECKTFKDRNGDRVQVGDDIQICRFEKSGLTVSEERYKVTSIKKSGYFIEVITENGRKTFPSFIIKS